MHHQSFSFLTNHRVLISHTHTHTSYIPHSMYFTRTFAAMAAVAFATSVATTPSGMAIRHDGDGDESSHTTKTNAGAVKTVTMHHTMHHTMNHGNCSCSGTPRSSGRANSTAIRTTMTMKPSGSPKASGSSPTRASPSSSVHFSESVPAPFRSSPTASASGSGSGPPPTSVTFPVPGHQTPTFAPPGSASSRLSASASAPASASSSAATTTTSLPKGFTKRAEMPVNTPTTYNSKFLGMTTPAAITVFVALILAALFLLAVLIYTAVKLRRAKKEVRRLETIARGRSGGRRGYPGSEVV